MCRSCSHVEKATSSLPLFGEAEADAAESMTLCMCGHPKRENREILLVSVVPSDNFRHGGTIRERLQR